MPHRPGAGPVWHPAFRGQILPFVAILMIGLLGAGGLMLDAGRAYLNRAELVRAVDASALAAARSIRQGTSVATQQVQAVAAANAVAEKLGLGLHVTFDTNALGEQTVTVFAVRTMPTVLSRLIGVPQVEIRASAVAAVPPVDLVLVLDQSGSLATENAWKDLKDAAKSFVDQFDDDIDQMSLVAFQLHARLKHPLGAPFRGQVIGSIDQMKSAGDTNAGEGLRLALEEIQGPSTRKGAVKVVVFFTDGRPTAFRGEIGGVDRAIAVSTVQTGTVRGYFDDPDDLRDNVLNTPDGCRGVGDCFGWNEFTVREQSRQSGIDRAAQIRDAEVFVYTIGLGNPDASDPLMAPDLDYLRLLANENGIASSGEPRGRMYFAPTPADLEAVFRQVADDLLIRLAG